MAEIDHRRPVIVLVDRGFWVLSRTHCRVFGYDDEGFVAHDGFTASKRYRYAEFRDIWGKMGNAYLLVYRDEGRGGVGMRREKENDKKWK